MKIYYAHCMAIYRTKQEERDLEILSKLGFEVINPADYEKDYTEWLSYYDEDIQSGIRSTMDFWVDLALTCDCVAFRGLPDGRIPIGVAKEVWFMVEKGKPAFELISNFVSRVMTLEETREYLKEIGQR